MSHPGHRAGDAARLQQAVAFRERRLEEPSQPPVAAQVETGWQGYALSDGGGPIPVTRVPEGVPPTMPLGVLGITSLTAYFGLKEIGKPQPGETVVVSGAAGATGSVAGQLARIWGCRVVGIAGGPEKCKWLTGELGFDAAIDYRSE